MPIASPIGFLDVVNATLRASQVETTSRLTVANTAATKNFSVGDRFHVDKDSVDPVSVTGNVVASGIKISNLTISPTFDLAAVSNVGNTTSNTLQFANATTGFVTSSNVEIGGNITLTSNAQVKVGSNVLAEYTGPHGRDPTTPLLKKFPEIAFDASKLDGNDTTNVYVQAGYTVTASDDRDDRKAWEVFDGISDGVTLNAWQTNSIFNTSTGLPTSSTETYTDTLPGGTNHVGVTLKLQLPKAIQISRIFMSAYDSTGSDDRSPKEGVFLGSTNGTSWELIKSFTESDLNYVSYNGDELGKVEATITGITNTSYYSYIVLIVKKIQVPNLYGVLNIKEIKYYGTEEPAPPGDLSLDTTLKSTFNSVRSNNYVMYFDGEDPAAGNVPKYLPSGSAKSITPNNVVFDATNNCWTLNGSTESNVTTGSLGFEGDVPHTVSTWINASNLEANATTQQLFSIGSGYDKAFLKVDDTQIAANTWHNVTYAYQGEGGSKVTYVDGRKVEEAQVEDTFGDYPPFAMTGYKTGGYCVSASSTAYTGTDWNSWYLYDDRPSGNNGWHGANNFNSSDNYAYNGAANLGGQAGEWNKLEMPHKLVLNYFKIRNRGNVSDAVQSPEDFKIIGSNDDVNWTDLFSVTGVTWSGPGVEKTYSITPNSIGYKYLAFLCTRTVGSASLTLNNISYYGHKEGDLTRFPEPTRVLKYPHVTMTGPAQRGYVASASSVYSGGDASAREPYNAFGSQTIGSEGDIRWRSADNSGSLGSFTGSWLKLELPHKIVLSQIKYRAYHSSFSPESYVILASNNDSTWVKLHDATGQTNGTFTISSFSEGTPSTPYKYYAFLTRIITNSGTAVIINDLHFFGTQEDTGTPTIVGGPFAGKVANFRVYDQYLGDERIQEIYDAQKDAFGHKKSSMTFYKGRVGVGTTEPEGALTVLDEPHALAKFPARAISADDSYVEGDGQIKLSAADGTGYQAFDGLTSTSWDSTPTRNTRVSEEVDFGAWLKIQTPESMSLKKAEIESKPDWKQVGADLLGPDSGGQFGRAVACNHDGTRVIVGGYPFNSQQGKVIVYDWNGTTWTQVGNVLTGVASNAPHFGHTVAISGDGNIIAVAAPFEHSNGADAGTVRVFYLVGATWTILPDSGSLTGDVTSGLPDVFRGSAANMYLGYGGVKLSYDGYTIIIPEQENATAFFKAGIVRVFKYTNGAWSQKGSTLTGTAANERIGFSLDMSEDGNHIIFTTDDGGASGTNPYVKVYEYGSDWTQKGSTFTYTANDGRHAVAISNDGNVVAIGQNNADVADGARAEDGGVVKVYNYEGSAWVIKGTINDPVEATDEEFGSFIALSGDGKRLIVSKPDEGSTNQGQLFTFEYTGSSWITRQPVASYGALGDSADGDARIGRGGNDSRSLAISRDGSAIIAGEQGFDPPSGSNGGRVRVFNMPSNIKSIWGSNDDVNWTKITTAPTREEATSNVAGLAFGYDDRLEFKNLDNPNYYKYHAIVADAFTRLKDIKLFGIRNQGSSTLHDGTLTLTKNLDVPRIGPPLDADDTPRRDRLVVEYNTSTNPTFDGAVRDTSGRGLDGMLYGGASYDATEKAVDIAGTPNGQSAPTTSAYLEVGQRLPFKGNQAHTISLWFKKNNVGSEYTLVNMWREGTNYATTGDHSGVMVLSSGKIQFWHWSGDIAYTDPLGDTNYGGWRHVVAIYTGETVGDQKLYVNGTEAVVSSTSGGGGAIDITNAKMTVGQDYFRGNYYYQANTEFAGIKVYDTALTAQEVKTLYDMGRCDEGGHVVNFSKTRVGIGLGDGEVPRGDLDVRGDTIFRSRVGIGTNDPGGLLDIRAVASDPSVPTVHIGDNAADFGDYGMVNLVRNPAAAGSKAHLAFIRNGNTVFSQGFYNDTNTFGVWPSFGGVTNTPAMSFATNGNVGIGVTDPNQKLHVNGTIKAGTGWSTQQSYHSIVTCANYIYKSGDIVTLNSVANDANARQYLDNYGNQYINMSPCMSGSTFYLYGRHGNNRYRDTLAGSQFFTGQHVGYPEDYDLKSNVADYVGLTVCSAGTGYRSYNGSTGDIIVGNDAIAINESLPNIKLSSKSCDPSVMGVVSNRVDKNTLNTDGTFEEDDKPTGFQNSLYDRVRFNSVGEGALWVTDINGPIQNGDYVTTSNVAGYCMKQADDILHNYTVAKVTMPCDFNPILQPVKVSKKVTKYKDTWVTEKWEEITEDEYNTPKVGESQMKRTITVEDGITIYKKQTVYQEWDKNPNDGESIYINKEYEEIAKDELGRTILENHPDGKMELPYKIRYLDASGNEVDEATHVIKAVFLGCTYHCG